MSATRQKRVSTSMKAPARGHCADPFEVDEVAVAAERRARKTPTKNRHAS
jgi:hypothetical protein